MIRVIQGFRYAPLLILGLALFAVSPCYAKNIYVAQTTAGLGTGADCANARPVAWFNATANWGAGPAQITAGDTVHLCGTISSELDAQGSGVAGSPITLLFENNAQMSSPVFSPNAINLVSRSYITVDGGTNGIIQNTANGTGLANHLPSRAIEFTGGNNIEVRNLTFSNLYVHTTVSDTAVDQTAVNCIYANGFGNSISFHNNVAHDVGWCVHFQVGRGQASSGIDVYNNEIYNFDHGVTLGLNVTSGSGSSVSIHDNHFHDPANWDTTANVYHHDGIHAFAYCGDGIAFCATANWTGLSIYNNLFDGNWGRNNTANVFFEGNEQNSDIYNNVSIGFASVNLNNGAMAVGGINCHVYNNTLTGSGLTTQTNALLGLSGPGTIVRNNVITTAGQLIQANPLNSAGQASTFTFSNNTYANGGNNSFLWCLPGPACNFWSFGQFSSNWVPASGETASQAVASANIDSAGHPLTGSAAIGAGANLTSLGITPLDSDKARVVRPATGAWDAGAYQFGGTRSSNPPNPPVNLRAIVN